MKTFQVGGAVRDRLLGVEPGDRDWVVVGATADEMLEAGYIQVGRDFPVFLHPATREEYALARTERKAAPGYRGFVVHADPSVTLEDDLRRRDLTVNAIALDADGVLIDPFGGQRDLRSRVLRHVSEAFAEDPVRILRLARFAARWPDFSVAAETLELCRRMVAAGEADALVPERVWQELSRGLMASRPGRMLEVLRACGALARVLPEVDRQIDSHVHLCQVLDQSAASGAPLPVRWACLVHGLDATLAEQVAQRLRVSAECRELGAIVARERIAIHRSEGLDAPHTLRLLERCDALRRPERFELALWACECDARGRPDCATAPYPPRTRLATALRAVLAVDAAAVAAQAIARGAQGPAVGDAVRRARLAAL